MDKLPIATIRNLKRNGGKMNIPFKKMHGAGNDFIVLKYEDFDREEAYSLFAQKSCHRHFGIGADGILVAAPSKTADIKMFYLNSDGSRANMCGNGIRCFAKFVYDEGMVSQDIFTVETLAGILKVEVKLHEKQVKGVKVNMGKMVFEPELIPVKSNKTLFINELIEAADKSFEASSVLLGVPHTVIFVDDLTDDLVIKYGPIIEKNSLFPQNTNVNFAKVVNRSLIQVKTWERGAGFTLACGTGVTSVCGIAHHLNLADSQVEAEIDGGKLLITILPEGDIYMEGPAEDICSGLFFYEKQD